MEETTPRRNCGFTGPCAHGGGPLTGGRGLATDGYTLGVAGRLSAHPATRHIVAGADDSQMCCVRPDRIHGHVPRDETDRLLSGRRWKDMAYSLLLLAASARRHVRRPGPQADRPHRAAEGRSGSRLVLLSSTYLSHRAARPAGTEPFGSRSTILLPIPIAPHRGSPGARGGARFGSATLPLRHVASRDDRRCAPWIAHY